MDKTPYAYKHYPEYIWLWGNLVYWSADTVEGFHYPAVRYKRDEPAPPTPDEQDAMERENEHNR
jgi:hypothetical protein